MSYSPHLRTAVLLSGSGTAGAYHAGVLRALHEAGVKIDVIGGRGIGAVGAVFAAIDAAPRVWEEGGLWRRRPAVRWYRWRPALQSAALLALLASAVLLVPLLVLATGLIAYPLSFLVQMINVDAGSRMAAAYASMIGAAFSPPALPTVIPRFVVLLIAAASIVLAVSAARHGDRGRWWGRLVGSPWTSDPGLRHVQQSLWQLFRGPTSAKQPPTPEFSRRYTELLIDNLGQPGFRELILTTLNLETRTDLVFAALAESRRQAFFHRPEASGDLIDLAGTGRHHVLDALAGSLSLPALTEPQPIAFSPESYWKGEVHRTCDRPGAVGRLLFELSYAGVEQVIVASATADRSAPHRLSRNTGTLEARLAEHLSAAEAAAVRDATRMHGERFRGVFLIQPAHNPVGSFDFEGAFDERSNRFQSLSELVDRGYEDAYRQFIEPEVGGADEPGR
ncbi:MAG: patatin-like phospholipase family protein [Vicinamibacterales bacterium]|nr:patatin-like phospholipase family protein [Vicinamibacterales bacterium]